MRTTPRGRVAICMQVLWDSIMRHCNQNKTYAPLEVEGAQGRIIGGIVKRSYISESENAVTCPNFLRYIFCVMVATACTI